MIIDFHTHIFNEKIAAKALSKLADISGYTPCMDGTAAGLIKSMEKADVDISVVLPVVTDPKQFDSILRFSSQINEEFFYEKGTNERKILSFAGLHPLDDDYISHLKLIKNMGFKGIKLHPNYQGVLFSDTRYKRIIDKASELDILVSVHAGFDPYTPSEEYSTPDMIAEVVKEVSPKALILAHMGSNENYKEAEEKLCGLNIYLDSAFSLSVMDPDQFIKMVKKHGSGKVLFATDCPWSNQKECIDILNSMNLSDENKEQILYKNASKLLNL